MHGFYNLFQVFALAFKVTQRSNVSSANLTYYNCNMNLTEVLHFYLISESVKMLDSNCRKSDSVPENFM